MYSFLESYSDYDLIAWRRELLEAYIDGWDELTTEVYSAINKEINRRPTCRPER